MKVYISKGRPTPELRKMIDHVQSKINEKIANGEEVVFEPARTVEELKELYKNFCVDDADIISETKTNEEPQTNNSNNDFNDDGGSDFIDPLTEKNVLERDYTKPTESLDSEIAEPSSIDDTFEMPDDLDDEPSAIGGGSNRGGNNAKENKQKEVFNEDLKDLDPSQKRKAFKRTAKAIVMAYKQFSGMPFEYLATKDINEAKMTEYHTTNVLDVDMMLELPDDVYLTVRQFFEQQCMQADGLFKLDPEIEHEIEEALTDVLMEKQVALTPMQRLGFYVAQDMGSKIVALVKMKSQTNAVLNHLMEQHKAKVEAEKEEEEAKKPKPATEPKEANKQPKNDNVEIIEEK